MCDVPIASVEQKYVRLFLSDVSSVVLRLERGGADKFGNRDRKPLQTVASTIEQGPVQTRDDEGTIPTRRYAILSGCRAGRVGRRRRN